MVIVFESIKNVFVILAIKENVDAMQVRADELLHLERKTNKYYLSAHTYHNHKLINKKWFKKKENKNSDSTAL